MIRNSFSVYPYTFVLLSHPPFLSPLHPSQMPLNLTNAVTTARQLLVYTMEAANFSDKMDVIFVAQMIEKFGKFAEKYKEVGLGRARLQRTQPQGGARPPPPRAQPAALRLERPGRPSPSISRLLHAERRGGKRGV